MALGIRCWQSVCQEESQWLHPEALGWRQNKAKDTGSHIKLDIGNVCFFLVFLVLVLELFFTSAFLLDPYLGSTHDLLWPRDAMFNEWLCWSLSTPPRCQSSIRKGTKHLSCGSLNFLGLVSASSCPWELEF